MQSWALESIIIFVGGHLEPRLLPGTLYALHIAWLAILLGVRHIDFVVRHTSAPFNISGFVHRLLKPTLILVLVLRLLNLRHLRRIYRVESIVLLFLVLRRRIRFWGDRAHQFLVRCLSCRLLDLVTFYYVLLLICSFKLSIVLFSLVLFNLFLPLLPQLILLKVLLDSLRSNNLRWIDNRFLLLHLASLLILDFNIKRVDDVPDSLVPLLPELPHRLVLLNLIFLVLFALLFQPLEYVTEVAAYHVLQFFLFPVGFFALGLLFFLFGW